MGDDRFTIEEGKFGPRLVLQTAWSPDIGEYMRSKGIKELLLNYARGFEGDDVSFVKELPDLEGLEIIHRTIDDVSPIHALSKLRSLAVDTYCKTALDFSCFPRLEQCSLEWRKKVSGLFDLPRLTVLWINEYDAKTTKDIGRLTRLEHLSLANGRTEDLGGLASLQRLSFLGLYRLRKLRSLRGVETLTSLRTLEIQDCTKLESLDEVGELSQLRRLLFTDCGNVRSIAFLDGLNDLEEVLFYGSTKVEDGDLDPLTRLPALSNLSFQNRRHYSHKREDFEQY